jgi:hypothetical protein
MPKTLFPGEFILAHQRVYLAGPEVFYATLRKSVHTKNLCKAKTRMFKEQNQNNVFLAHEGWVSILFINVMHHVQG